MYYYYVIFHMYNIVIFYIYMEELSFLEMLKT